MTHEQITSHGWAWHGYCNCSISGKVYKKGNFTLTHFANGTYKLKQGFRKIADGKDTTLNLQQYEQMALR